jgi:hypothetical protein
LQVPSLLATVESPQVGHPPDPDNFVALRILFRNKKGVSLYDSASVAAETRHFEDLPDLMVADLRTVNCSWLIGLAR